MGGGSRRRGRITRRPVKKRRTKSQPVTRPPPAPPARPARPVARTLSSDEEEPTDYDLLVSVLGPAAKRPRVGPLAPEGGDNEHVIENEENSINSADEAKSEPSDVEDPPDSSHDPFKSHFEQVLSEKQVDTLREVAEALPQYRPAEDCFLGLVEEVCPLPPADSQLKKEKSQLFVKSQLKTVHSQLTSSRLERDLFATINSYKDLLYTRRNFANGEAIRRTYTLHALNHVLKTRSKVLKNNARLSQAAKTNKTLDDVCDQGLTRPKVLILLPFREAALRTVNTITQLLLPGGEGQVSNRKRFKEEYSEGEHLPSKTPKPKSYEEMFAGNIDDCFRVGVAIKRNSVRLYSEFYSSDIILASPLGLRTIIGAEGDKNRDYDFLSSIELLVIDQCDVFLMQNWDHIQHIFAHLHLTPRKSHDVDISRLREWAVNGWGQYYRQTLIFSSFYMPEINSIFNSHCHNYAGRVRVGVASEEGCVSAVVVPAPQVFHRVPCQSHRELPDTRLQYFIDKVLPEFTGELSKQTAVFIPSYFDFVRVRNHMKREELSYCQLSEYTKTSQISRCRSQFFHKQAHFLLYTERLHFFRRYHIRGINHVIFYALPLYDEFYPELVNMLEEAGQLGGVTCTVLYSRYELHMLSRIVGSRRARIMAGSDDNIQTLVLSS